MTKQIINIGTSANKGNGDPLRTAFTKVNANFDDLYAAIGTGITAGATAPAGPGVGDLWYDANSGRTYIYYDSSWVDASPVDGAGISSTNQLVNGAYTLSLGANGALTFPDNSVIASYKPVTVIAATTTAQTITDNASAAFIQFVDTVDTASAYSTGTFTAPYTGYYQINMSVYFSTTVSLTSTSFLLIDTNLDFTKQVRIIDGNWTGSYLHYSTVISATAGDAIRVAFRQVSGGDIDVSSGSRLTIHRVSIS